ncbi:MAG: prepilin-type N-terminal cleavage/methylation domain-containing protein [Candidatus Acidiferrales bacterium]
MSKFNKKAHCASGFTLIEVLVAISVLVIGLVGIALTMTSSLSSTGRSKYMSLAATLASEKLEDLNRWPKGDPNVYVAPAGTAGSLTADVGGNVTVGTNTQYVAYYDQVAMTSSGQVSSGGATGAFVEVVSGLGAGGAPVYTVTSHSPDGTISTTASGTAPTVTYTFERRWMIEQDVPIAGVKRITVLVRSLDPTIQPPVNFQMSMVRP